MIPTDSPKNRPDTKRVMSGCNSRSCPTLAIPPIDKPWYQKKLAMYMVITASESKANKGPG